MSALRFDWDILLLFAGGQNFFRKVQKERDGKITWLDLEGRKECINGVPSGLGASFWIILHTFVYIGVGFGDGFCVRYPLAVTAFKWRIKVSFVL